MRARSELRSTEYLLHECRSGHVIDVPKALKASDPYRWRAVRNIENRSSICVGNIRRSQRFENSVNAASAHVAFSSAREATVDHCQRTLHVNRLDSNSEDIGARAVV